ncbi:hypothetical protein TNCV_4245791 [Trichonephila clavipes]|nr:hypothetical protein TNCV_4245791 [Trichonephila clavipes]
MARSSVKVSHPWTTIDRQSWIMKCSIALLTANTLLGTTHQSENTLGSGQRSPISLPLPPTSREDLRLNEQPCLALAQLQTLHRICGFESSPFATVDGVTIPDRRSMLQSSLYYSKLSIPQSVIIAFGYL